jgi:hypothetical protein
MKKMMLNARADDIKRKIIFPHMFVVAINE